MFVFDWPMMTLLLLAGHALADYPLQGDFLANAKNRNTPIGAAFWPHALFAHSIIHAAFVAVITGVWWLGLAEAVIHAITDWCKCEGRIGLNVDQAIHIACKLMWLIVAIHMAN